MALADAMRRRPVVRNINHKEDEEEEEKKKRNQKTKGRRRKKEAGREHKVEDYSCGNWISDICNLD
jgi:hypothetical protein